MTGLSDTSPEADRVLTAIYRNMPLDRKWLTIGQDYETAKALHAMGVRHVATMHNFGALEPRLVERSMTLFAREVMQPIAARR